MMLLKKSGIVGGCDIMESLTLWLDEGSSLEILYQTYATCYASPYKHHPTCFADFRSSCLPALGYIV